MHDTNCTDNLVNELGYWMRSVKSGKEKQPGPARSERMLTFYELRTSPISHQTLGLIDSIFS